MCNIKAFRVSLDKVMVALCLRNLGHNKPSKKNNTQQTKASKTNKQTNTHHHTCMLVKDNSFHKIHLSVTRQAWGEVGPAICFSTAGDKHFLAPLHGAGGRADPGHKHFLTDLLPPAVPQLNAEPRLLLAFIYSLYAASTRCSPRSSGPVHAFS